MAKSKKSEPTAGADASASKAKPANKAAAPKETAAPVEAAKTAPTAAKPATPAAAPQSKPAASAKSGKSAKAGGSSSQGSMLPSIDTNLAAQAAASMVVHRDRQADAAAPEAATDADAAKPAARQESTSFKNLKQGMSKSGLGNLFGPTGNPKKSHNSFGSGGQNFRNQTTGGFNKTGVPRRTSGG